MTKKTISATKKSYQIRRFVSIVALWLLQSVNCFAEGGLSNCPGPGCPAAIEEARENSAKNADQAVQNIRNPFDKAQKSAQDNNPFNIMLKDKSKGADGSAQNSGDMFIQ